MRKVTQIVCALGIAGGALFAQGTQAPVDGSQDALLAELRALRAELHQVASAGIRTQLLVVRLQSEEQRVFSLARQLAEAQTALNAARLEIAGEQARERHLEDAASRATGPARLAFQQAIREAGAQIVQKQGEELRLHARETELLRTVQDAQARWTDFSDQLDQLQRSLNR